MTCEDCTNSAAKLWHGFTAGCDGCKSRAVSRGPNYRRARDSGRQDRPYLEELRMLGVTHEQVKAAAGVDFEQRRVKA